MTAGLTLDVLGRITGRSMDKDAYRWSGYAAGTKGYSANPLNQYAAIDGLAPGHDANGNMLSVPGLAQGQGQVYRYNALDQLTGTQSGSSVLSYDPLGRLAYTSGAGGTMRFDYEGQDRIAELDAGGNITARYVHADGVDEPLVWYEGSGVTDRRWLHADERGSVIAISDASGSQTAVNRYDPYGVPASDNVGRFGYTGQAWLGDLGLWYYKARMYAPSIGRFVQTDPIGIAGGVNLYGYVGNDPANAADPSGLAATPKLDCNDQANAQDPRCRIYVGSSLGGATYAGVGTRSFFEFEELGVTPKGQSPLVGRVAQRTRKCSFGQRVAEHTANEFGEVASRLTKLTAGAIVLANTVGRYVPPAGAILRSAASRLGLGAGAATAASALADVAAGQSRRPIRNKMVDAAVSGILHGGPLSGVISDSLNSEISNDFDSECSVPFDGLVAF